MLPDVLPPPRPVFMDRLQQVLSNESSQPRPLRVLASSGVRHTRINRGLIVKSKSIVPGIVLIIVGTVFLLERLDVLPNIGPLMRDWWPVILIIVGVSMLIQRSKSSE